MKPVKDWPLKQSGFLLVDGQDEDGYWEGFASSEGGGNITWETEAIPIVIYKPGTVMIPKKDIERLLSAIEDYRMDVLETRGRNPANALDEAIAAIESALAAAASGDHEVKE